MRYIVAVVMGFLAGGLIYLISSPLPSPVPSVILIACWFASSYLLQRGAKTTAQVLARGFLLGAAEWLLMIGIGFIGAAIVGGGGIIKAVMSGGVSLFMALVCLAGYAVVHFWRREMNPEKPAQDHGSLTVEPHHEKALRQDADRVPRDYGLPPIQPRL